MFRNTTCTPTAPPPQQNSHICAHAPGQAVKLTNSTGCSNLTGTGFPYPQSTPTRRLPLPTHLSPPLPAQNSHICTHARTRSSGQTNKQQRLLYTPGRPRLGHRYRLPLISWPAKAGFTGGGAHLSPPLPPASAELSHLHIARTGQAVRPKSTGCPYASGRPRPGHRHRLPLRGLATPTPTHAQAAPTHLAPLHVLVLVSAV